MEYHFLRILAVRINEMKDTPMKFQALKSLKIAWRKFLLEGVTWKWISTPMQRKHIDSTNARFTWNAVGDTSIQYPIVASPTSNTTLSSSKGLHWHNQVHRSVMRILFLPSSENIYKNVYIGNGGKALPFQVRISFCKNSCFSLSLVLSFYVFKHFPARKEKFL